MLFEHNCLWSRRTLAQDGQTVLILARINNPCLYSVSRVESTTENVADVYAAFLSCRPALRVSFPELAPVRVQICDLLQGSRRCTRHEVPTRSSKSPCCASPCVSDSNPWVRSQHGVSDEEQQIFQACLIEAAGGGFDAPRANRRARDADGTFTAAYAVRAPIADGITGHF